MGDHRIYAKGRGGIIIDHDAVGKKGIKDVIENAHYPNRCIDPRVMDIQERDIGEWSDDHPLNITATFHSVFNLLFKDQF